MATTNFVPGTVVTSDWLNDIDAFFYQASSGITSAIERDGLDKNSDYVSVLDYGAVGDGTTDDLPAIQLALDSNAGKRRVYFPTPTVHYSLDGTLRIPSNTHMFGDSRSTILKTASTVVRNKSSVVTGHLSDHRSNIVIKNMTIDYNNARYTNSFGTGLGDGSGDVVGSGDGADQSALVICNSSNVYIDNVACLNGWKHSLDVTAPSYVDSLVVNTYDPEPSHDVFINNCYIEGGGDDNLTTHHSYNIWITNTISKNPLGHRTNDNTNCFEIDDGSRYVFLNNCVGIGGVCGLQIKGHAEAPAPYHIAVNNMRVINNIIGVEIRHTNYYGVVAEDDGTTPPSENEDGEAVADLGVSPNARHISLNNVTVIAPRNTVAAYSSAYSDAQWEAGQPVTLKAMYGVRISSYENVSINNLTISDGSKDYAEDYLPYIDMDGVPFRIYRGARNVQVKNVTIQGFPTSTIGFGRIDPASDTWNDPLPDGQKAAILMSGSCEGQVFFDGVNIMDGPAIGIRATASVPNVFVDNYNITSDNADTADSHGIYFTGSTTNKRVGQGYVSGFRNTVSNETANVSVRKKMLGTGAQQEAVSLVWEEGLSNDAVLGEGVSLNWKVRLVADTQDYSVAKIVAKKVTNSDSERHSDLYVQMSSDGTLDPVDTIKFGADKSIQTYGAQYVNTRAIVSAAATTVLDDSDHFVVVTGVTTHTLTLPAATTGRLLYLKNRSTGSVTVNAAGSDTFDTGTSNTMTAGNGRLLIANGTNWCTVSNS